MYAIRYRLREAWDFCKRVLRPIWNLTRWAAIAALLALFYQVAATEMQAEALAWDALSSENAGGHGKVSALERLNEDSTFPIPYVAVALNLKANEKYWLGTVDELELFRVPVPPQFRGRTNLQGIDLSLGNLASDRCPLKESVLQGLKVKFGLLSFANMECINFAPSSYLERTPLGQVTIWEGADFSEAFLVHSRFSGSKLRFANFANANIERANFDGAHLFGAYFAGARADDTRFEGVILDPEDPSMSEGSEGGEKVWGATEKVCPRRNVCFVAACLDRSVFDFAPARQSISVDFRGASLKGARFAGRIITADFGSLTDAEISGHNLKVCEPKQKNPSKSSKKAGDFPEQSDEPGDLRESKKQAEDILRKPGVTDLRGANLSFVVWKGTNFDGAMLNDAILKGSDLSGALNLKQEQLKEACIDEFTVLPDGISRKEIKQCSDSSTEATAASAFKPPGECEVNSQDVTYQFTGKITRLVGQALCIEAGAGRVLFADSSLARELKAVAEGGNKKRADIAADFLRWIDTEKPSVRCVRFPVKPRATAKVDPSKTVDTRRAERKPVEGTWMGWCGLSDEVGPNGHQSLGGMLATRLLGPNLPSSGLAAPTVVKGEELQP